MLHSIKPAVPCCLLLGALACGAAGLRISEIHTAGYSGGAEPFTGTDWIELHNDSADPLPLSGYYLTDKADRRRIWRLPALTLAADGYMVVLANGADAYDPVSGLHQASFALANEGEYLALFSPAGVAVSEFTPAYPAQLFGCSYGIPAGGSAYAYLPAPTPGAPNGADSYTGKCAPPAFSVQRGFHGAPFELALSTADMSAQVRYTIDGSRPGPDAGTPYTGPIAVSLNTVLTAVVVKDGYLPSDTVTHTYLFPQLVFAQPAAPAGFPSVWGPSQTADYAMNQSILNLSRYKPYLQEALERLPAVSVVMDPQELFGPLGLWGNAEERGPEWERRASVEYITGDPAGGFQVNAGLRMAGGAARGESNPKHPFRVYFRSDYGPAKLEYPLFAQDAFAGEGAVTRFDTLLFRGVMNFSWIQSASWFNSRALYFRDLWVADAQLAMGHVSTHGRPVHVFLNGLYWGVYILHEQVDARFASDYWGGDDTDWDVVKHLLVDDQPNANIYEVKDGDGAAWDAAQQLARLDMSQDANYQQLARYIDIDNHIDYMILNIYAANSDGVVIRDTEGNNWYGARLRADGEGFKFVNWDAEFALVSATEDKSDMGGVNNPATYYAALRANREWRVRFGDRVHHHLLNGGSLSLERTLERFNYRKAQFERPIILEAARWGDHGGFNRTPLDWQQAAARVTGSFFPARGDFVLDLFRADGLYPPVDAPAFSQHGGGVARGYPLTLQAGADAAVFYTLDGADPRLPGGAVSPDARVYTGAIAISQPLTVSARARAGGEWSALARAAFVPDPVAAWFQLEYPYGSDGASYWDTWLDAFTIQALPWFHHWQLGWMAGAGDPVSWLYAADLGPAWIWTAPGVYPWLYDGTTAQWLYYVRGTANPRWFYSSAAGAWINR